MRVKHFIIDGACDVQRAIKNLQPGDWVVVAAGEKLDHLFQQLTDAQLHQKTEAVEEKRRLETFLLSLSTSRSYHEEVSRTLYKLHLLLAEGMLMTFSDNSLSVYLKAMVTALLPQSIAASTTDAIAIDGRDVIICESNKGIPVIDWKVTENKLRERAADGTFIVSGAYGRRLTGDTLDLGFGGSQLTATIIGSVLKADEVRFFTAASYDGASELTYEEAAQVFSASSLVYPPVMLPLKKTGIPLVLSSMSSSQVLATITSSTLSNRPTGITGVICSDPMNLITVCGTGLRGSIGISSSIFGSLAKANVNIHFISQSISEYSISFAVKRIDVPQAIHAVQQLISDTQLRAFNDLSFDNKEVSIVTIYGNRMRNVPGISGKIYSTLGDANINIIAASQGGEEMSISVVVGETDARHSLEVLCTLL
ncbi:MAG: ACT domain-containing protein [Bacteroidales bacterium]|nr:ACT domain-containing protein [Bacteroidales bacterium]